MHNRINEITIKIPQNVKFTFKNENFSFNGVNGEIKNILNKNLILNYEKDIIKISTNNEKIKYKKKDIKKINALINTTRALFKNYINGVQNFYEKNLVLKGIGYKAEIEKNYLNLNIGYTNIVSIKIPDNIKVEINSGTNIKIKSISKEAVGQFAANIREKRKPEVYKGNGIKYKDEIIKFKSPKKSK